MSKQVSYIIKGIVSAMTLPLSNRQKLKTFARVSMYLEKNALQTVKTSKGDMKFHVLGDNVIPVIVEGFHRDEPETIKWIDDFIKPGDVVWDIGANIGMYAIYMALTENVRVIAFEPSGLNYGLFIEHIILNKVDKNIYPLCVALSNKTEIAHLNMKKVGKGHAFNTIGESRDQFGEFTSKFSQAVPVFTASDFCKFFNQPIPDHIKLDVDGIEPYIIEGMVDILPKVKSIIIEIEGTNLENVGELIEKPLFAAGFKEDESYRHVGGVGRNRVYINQSAIK